jgi:hypothetical protein
MKRKTRFTFAIGIGIAVVALLTLVLIYRPRIRYSETTEFVRVNSPIQDALEKDADLKTIQDLIDKDPSLVNAQVFGRSSVLFAVVAQRPEVVELLIRRGADVNASGRPPEAVDPPLVAAVALKDLKIAKLLIEAGANLDARSAEGYSLLEIAKLKHDPEMTALIKDALAKRSAR